MLPSESPIGDLYEIASRTHKGRVREANEDRCATFVAADCVGLVVADGVSSFNGGDVASRMAVEVTLSSFIEQSRDLRPAKRLYRAVQRANIAVHDMAMVVPELRSMATTLTAVVFAHGELHAAHVGDCRLYLLRAGRLQQLTKDHTVTAERMRLGVLSKARAQNHPARSTLTRSLGRELVARVDQFTTPVAARDLFMVCSDGIHGLLTETELVNLCSAPSAEGACQALIDAANERGSPDNVTAAVARVAEGAPPSQKQRGLLQAMSRALRRG
jgi:serine/threonine protein phosphatase PrpC